MPLFTIADLILLVIIAVILFIFLKPKGVLAGVKIMLVSLRIFANHKAMFLQNALFLFAIYLFIPIIFIALIYGIAIALNMVASGSTNYFLNSFIAIAGLIWIFGSIILGALSIPLLISFAYVIFYRQLLQILMEDNSERKFSFKEVINQEIKNFSKFLKFLLVLISITVSARIEAFLMMVKFWGFAGRFNLSRYFLPNYIKQVLRYVPMEYALYHNSPKRAVIKSYQINREWTALSVYGIAVSFLITMIIIFFICYIMSHMSDINALFSMEALVEKIGAVLATILFWFVFIAVILSFSIPLSLLINSFYFIVYLNYNNSIIEGKTDKFAKDFGLFGSFLNSVSELLARKFGSEPIPIYEKYIPIKEEYKKMIRLF